MEFTNHLTEYMKPSDREIVTENDLKELISIIDLTSLAADDTELSITQLCNKARTELGYVAAVCVYPKFIPLAKHLLTTTPVRIVSVANFPTGNEPLENVLANIAQAKVDGADEIDIVFPFMLYKSGDQQSALAFIEQCKKACGDLRLKVIIEICEFNVEQIYALSKKIIIAGADFIKTSTGKHTHGATLEAASAMLLAIKAIPTHRVGFKASGGITDVHQALSYIALAKKIMGDDWALAKHFRIGASKLIDEILLLITNRNHNQ